ncbi:hypothetical protein [Azospirillum argentinense]
MFDDPFASLSFVAGPAILTNACAILQAEPPPAAIWRSSNGATSVLRSPPETTASLCNMPTPRRRSYSPVGGVRPPLRRMALLNSAVALLGATATFFLESACGWALNRLHRGGDGSAAALPLRTHTHSATGDVQCPPSRS